MSELSVSVSGGGVSAAQEAGEKSGLAAGHEEGPRARVGASCHRLKTVPGAADRPGEVGAVPLRHPTGEGRGALTALRHRRASLLPSMSPGKRCLDEGWKTPRFSGGGPRQPSPASWQEAVPGPGAPCGAHF